MDAGVRNSEKTGEGVTTVKKGDHVVLHWRKSPVLKPDTKYLEGKNVNAGWVTTFNEKAIISENRLTSIPKIQFENEALLDVL